MNFFVPSLLSRYLVQSFHILIGNLFISFFSNHVIYFATGTDVAENMEEWYEDIMDLCLLLERAEKHVIMAASLHQKLLNTPRLFSAFFSNYANLEKQKKSTAEVR